MTTSTTRIRIVTGPFSALLALAICAPTASAAGTSWSTAPPCERPVTVSTVADLDPALGESPEGLTVAADGTVYVAWVGGEVLKMRPDGSRRVVGRVPIPSPDAGVLLGLATDRQGVVYAAVARFDGAPQGVWRIDPRTGDARLFATTDPAGFPNGVAFDGSGNLLVSDSKLGVIWSVDRAGKVTEWLRDPALAPGELGFGVNGIALDARGDLWFANSEAATVGVVPVGDDGRPNGPVRIHAHDPALYFGDGLALDVGGAIWVGSSYTVDKLTRVGRYGRVKVVADASDGLDYTASVAFGRKAEHLYLANHGADFGTPSVQRADVGVRGLPLRYP